MNIDNNNGLLNINLILGFDALKKRNQILLLSYEDES